MSRIDFDVLRRSRRRLAALAVALMMFLPAAAATALHVRLEASTPGPDEVLTAAPQQLRLRFSGPVEQRYTSLTLLAPDGGAVPLGALEFVSDREFTAAVAPVAVPGVYTLQWRTAGADGHVLQGSYGFTLAVDPAAADTVPAAPDPGAGEVLHQHHEDHDEHAAASAAALPVFARWLHFSALVLLLGAVAGRTLLLPRLRVGEATRIDLRRGVWRATALAALVLLAAAVLRLWVQSSELHGPDRAWDSRLLSIMLTDTTWGRAWLLQAFFFTLLGAGIAAARIHRDRYARFLAVPAALGLAAIPALSGHAAGVADRTFVVVNDAAHVVAAGTWIGLLALLVGVILPRLQRLEPVPDAARAHAVERFSPVALAAAAVVVATGVINSLLHFSAVEQLWTTRYGAALLAKLAIFSLVIVSGFYNWRVIRPRLAEQSHARRFRFSAAFELVVAAFVLLATALLTGLPRP